MGKAIAKKIHGMSLGAKVSLAVAFTMLLTVFILPGWVTPNTSEAASSPLMHNSDNLGTKYGTWGTTFTCATCHARTTTNIKRIASTVQTPDGPRPVVFTRMTASSNSQNGVFGNDNRTYAVNGSTNICEVCHRLTTFHQYSASKVTDKTHNGNKDCTSCHSHSTGFKPVGCNGCHGYPPSTTTIGGPDGLASPATNALGAAPANAGAHLIHTGLSMVCDTCHNGYGSKSMPSGTIDIGFSINNTNFPQFSGTVTGGSFTGNNALTGETWSAGTGTTITTAANAATCSVYCHGNWTGSGGTNPSWTGTTIACNSCHGDKTTPPATGNHNVHLSATGANLSCASCHPDNGTNMAHLNGNVQWNLSAISASATYKPSGGTAANSGGTGAPAPSAAYGSCTVTCHGNLSPTWGTTLSGTAVCDKCHTTTLPATSFKATDGTTTGVISTIHVSHINGTHGYSSPTLTCNQCHTVPVNPGDAGHYSAPLPASTTFGALASTGGLTPTFTAATQTCANVYCHGASLASNKPTPPAGVVLSPTWTATLLTGVASNDCGKCHGYPPPTSDGVHTGVTPAQCQTCHPEVNATGTGFVTPSLHINGQVDVVCTGCHSTVQGGERKAVATEFSAQSHHVQKAGGVTGNDCYQCHWEANSDGSINTTYHKQVKGDVVDLVVWSGGTRPTTYTAGTSAVQYTANGTRAQIDSLNKVCLGCHTGGTYGTAPANPFSDGNSPSKYAWDGKSIAERYSQTGTAKWSQYSTSGGSPAIGGTNGKHKIIKAFSAHGNAANNAMGWSTNGGTDGTIPNITSNVNVDCYDCHNSHGSAVAGVTSNYSSSTGRNKGGILKNTTNGLGGYAATYAPAGGTMTYRQNGTTTTTTAGSYNPGAGICFDCHFNATATGRPWGYQATYGATQAIGGYFDTPYFGSYTVPMVKRTDYTNYKMGGAVNSSNDRRKPMGGHFGTSVSGDSVSSRAAHQIGGLCTPCHDPHGVSPTLTEQYAVPMLKGTWLTSPYKEDKAGIAVKRGGGSQFAGVSPGGSIPGYHIDQNTLLNQPSAAGGGAAATTAKGNMRGQVFRAFSSSAYGLQTQPASVFAGLCLNCHTQANLTTRPAASSTNWKTKDRVHESVAGWAATTGTGGNLNNKVHAYTCSKCHAPHVSRLPRLMVTNCLNVNHRGQVASGGTVSSTAGSTTTNVGNILQNSTTYSRSGNGAGRFPGGGGRYQGTSGNAQNPGPWWFQTAKPTTASYGPNCHNSATAGGSAYNPTNQQWNNRTPW